MDIRGIVNDGLWAVTKARLTVLTRSSVVKLFRSKAITKVSLLFSY
jgi:hypothetical protein